jgi:membrane-associated phospholipid phosphatase
MSKHRKVSVFTVQVYLLVVLHLPLQLKAQPTLPRFDDRVLISIQEHRTPAQTGVFRFLSHTIHYANAGIPAGLLIAGIANKDKGMRQNALYVASSTASTYLFTGLIKLIVKRPRPYIANKAIQPLYQARQYSFPSGHSSTTFASATALSVVYPRWYVIVPSFAWSSSVAYSRMYLGVHYPTDVLGGALLGSGTALSLQFIR